MWICKNCHHVGEATNRGGHSSLPCCEACGHGTIVPVDTPTGAALATKLGLSNADLNLAAYARELARWKGFSTVGRAIGICLGGAVGATCVSESMPAGSLPWFAVAFYCALSIGMHYWNRPAPPPGASPGT